jgi:hypothetical protein
MKMRIRSVLGMVFCLAMVAVPLVAGSCMDSVDRQVPRDERSTVVEVDNPDDGVAESASSVYETPELCCSSGYYRCPNTGAIFDYEALACSSGPRKSTAASQCDVACTMACVDSGWLDPGP